MTKPRTPYLRAETKLSLPAELVGMIDTLLTDPLTRKPRYGARSELTARLYEHWIAHISGNPLPPLPSLDELRS